MSEDKTKKSRLASKMFIFSGLTFLFASVITAVGNKSFLTGNSAAFLTVGIALIMVGLSMRQHSKNQIDN
ncbi:hypothetical protein ACFLVZ_02260 [Chloroflexota bacterium]